MIKMSYENHAYQHDPRKGDEVTFGGILFRFDGDSFREVRNGRLRRRRGGDENSITIPFSELFVKSSFLPETTLCVMDGDKVVHSATLTEWMALRRNRKGDVIWPKRKRPE